MKHIKSPKWYLWSLLFNLYAAIRLLDTAGLLPETALLTPETKMTTGVILLILFPLLYFLDKKAGADILETFKTNHVLKLLCITGIILIFIDLFARDLIAMS